MSKAIELAHELDDKADHVADENNELEVMRNAAQELRRLAAIEQKYDAIMAMQQLTEVSDRYSVDGHNDEITSMLPVGTKLYSLPKI